MRSHLYEYTLDMRERIFSFVATRHMEHESIIPTVLVTKLATTQIHLKKKNNEKTKNASGEGAIFHTASNK